MKFKMAKKKMEKLKIKLVFEFENKFVVSRPPLGDKF